MKTFFIAQYRVSQRNTLIYFEWIYISILPPPIFMVLEGGGWKFFSPVYIGVEGRKRYVLIPTPIMWHFWKGILSKNITMRKGFYNFPWLKWLLVIIGQLSNFDRVLFQSGLPYTLHTCTLFIVHFTPLLKTRYPSKRGYNKSC